MKEVLDKDKRNGENLERLYTSSILYVRELPHARKKELEQNVPMFESRLQHNRASVKESECAILVAGKEMMSYIGSKMS